MPGSNDETLPMSFAERVFRLLGAAVLAAYSGYALIHSEVILPTKRGSLHLHGVAGGLVVGSLLCAVVYLLVPVISRSSHIWGFQRARFTLWSKRAGWFLFGAGNGLSIAGFDNPASAVPMPLSVILGAGLFVGVAMIGWLPDRFPAARAITSSVTPKPVTNAARVTGLVLMLLALPVALIAVPGMVQMRLGAFVAASAAIVMLAVGGYVFRSKPLDPAPVRSAYRSKWLPVRIALILVVGIWAIWYTSIRQLGRTVEQDDVEYQVARSLRIGETSGTSSLPSSRTKAPSAYSSASAGSSAIKARSALRSSATSLDGKGSGCMCPRSGRVRTQACGRATSLSGTPSIPASSSTSMAWSSRCGRPETVTVPMVPTPTTRIGKLPPCAV